MIEKITKKNIVILIHAIIYAFFAALILIPFSTLEYPLKLIVFTIWFVIASAIGCYMIYKMYSYEHIT